MGCTTTESRHRSRIAAVHKAVALLGGMEKFVKKGSRVCLKPNISFPHGPERATNTHPEVFAAFADAAEIIIIDFPFNPPQKCLSLLSIADACRGIKNTHAFAIYDEKLFDPLAIENGKTLKEVKIIKDLLHSDVLIGTRFGLCRL